jgi:hypothetical protein
MVEWNPCSNGHDWGHPGNVYKRSREHWSCCDAFMPHHEDWNRKEGKFGDGCTCRRCGQTRGGANRTSGGVFGQVFKAAG